MNGLQSSEQHSGSQVWNKLLSWSRLHIRSRSTRQTTENQVEIQSPALHGDIERNNDDENQIDNVHGSNSRAQTLVQRREDEVLYSQYLEQVIKIENKPIGPVVVQKMTSKSSLKEFRQCLYHLDRNENFLLLSTDKIMRCTLQMLKQREWRAGMPTVFFRSAKNWGCHGLKSSSSTIKHRI